MLSILCNNFMHNMCILCSLKMWRCDTESIQAAIKLSYRFPIYFSYSYPILSKTIYHSLHLLLPSPLQSAIKILPLNGQILIKIHCIAVIIIITIIINNMAKPLQSHLPSPNNKLSSLPSSSATIN